MIGNRVGHRFTVAAYHRMIEKGYLTPKDRVELIRGEILVKRSVGREHAVRARKLNRLFNRVLGDRVSVDVQNPLVLNDSEPEPDIVLLKPSDDDYELRKPEAKDAFVVIEVSFSSIDDDRDVKLPLYAENGIPEYWIVNLEEECLEVYRSPRADGTYRKKLVLRRGDKVGIAALKGTNFEVADLI